MSILLKTPREVSLEIAARVKAVRLAQNMSQVGLSHRSGVSLGSLKRFETTGQISLESLLRLALTLRCLHDFDSIFREQPARQSLFQEVKQKPTVRKRGWLK